MNAKKNCVQFPVERRHGAALPADTAPLSPEVDSGLSIDHHDSGALNEAASGAAD